MEVTKVINAAEVMGGGFRVNEARPFIYDGKVWINSADGKDVIQVNTTATLRKDEWEMLDTVLLPERRDRLQVTSALVRSGLTKSINGYAVMKYEWETINDVGAPILTMNPDTQGQADTPVYELNSIPLPMLVEDMYINDRKLQESRNNGIPLDTTILEQGRNSIDQKIEDMVINGVSSYTYGGGTLYGIVDTPNKVAVDFGNSDKNWGETDKTAADIRADVLTMKTKLIEQKAFGRYMLIIPTEYDVVLDRIFDSTANKTLRQTILDIEGIDEIVVADKMPADTVAMIYKDRSTIELITGMEMQLVQWQTHSRASHHFRLMTISVPRIRATQGGYKGIVVMS